jgi:hypothetical protein
LLFVDLCAVIWFVWRLPDAKFDQTKKVVSTVVGGLLYLFGLFGVKPATRKVTLRAFLQLPPVVLCIIAFTVGVWFFILPFHGITLKVVSANQALEGVKAAVDGKGKGASNAEGTVRIGGLDAVSHTLKLEKAGYVTEESTIGFDEVLFKRQIVRTLDRAQGRIQVTSNPAGAAIYVDNESSPRGSTPHEVTVPAGRHQIRLEKAGFKPPPPHVVYVAGGDSQPVGMDLVQIPPKQYRVFFSTYPAADIYIDGQKRGNTGLAGSYVWLPGGPHQLQFRVGGVNCGDAEAITVDSRLRDVPRDLRHCGGHP